MLIVFMIISCSYPYIFVIRESCNQHPYQVSTSYTLWFSRYSLEKIFRSRSNQGHVMMLHTYNPQPISLPSKAVTSLEKRHQVFASIQIRVTTF